MLNAPIQPVQQGCTQVQNIAPQEQPRVIDENQKNALKEQSLAVSFDIAAEYSAISRMNNLLASVAKELKSEEDSERKKLLEARVSTLNNMILQREAKINQMETVKAQIDRQAAA